MKSIVLGQVFLILTCLFYSIWWYLGFRPGVSVNRVGGRNGILLLITVGLGLAGLALTLLPFGEMGAAFLVPPGYLLAAGVILYVLLMLITRFMFERVVTSELFLIVGWTLLEACVLDYVGGQGILNGAPLMLLSLVLLVAGLISLCLYVAYYRVEEWRAFYLAMVPLATEAIFMAVLLVTLGIFGHP